MIGGRHGMQERRRSKGAADRNKQTGISPQAAMLMGDGAVGRLVISVSACSQSSTSCPGSFPRCSYNWKARSWIFWVSRASAAFNDELMDVVLRVGFIKVPTLDKAWF